MVRQAPVEFRRILDHYSIHIKMEKGSKGRIRCPFHDDKRPSCQVDLRKNVFYCFPCGVGGGVIKFVMMKEKLDKNKALLFMKKTFGITISKNVEKEEKQKDGIKFKIQKIKIHPLIERCLGDVSKLILDGSLKDGKIVAMFEWLMEVNESMIENEVEYQYYKRTREGRYSTMFSILYEYCYNNVKKLKLISAKECGFDKLKLLRQFSDNGDEEKFFELMNDPKVILYMNQKSILFGIDDMMDRLQYWIGFVVRNYSQEDNYDGKFLDRVRKRLIDLNDVLRRMILQGSNWSTIIDELEWRV